jgi:hypothetical protein
MGHDYGNTEDNMEVVENLGKRPYLNTAEKFNIYNQKRIKQNFILNDNVGEQMNPIFEVCGRLVPPPFPLLFTLGQ